MVSRKKQRQLLFNLTIYIIFPLIFINAYAFWQLSKTAEHWTWSFIPSSTDDTLLQLAVILGINNLVILLLLLIIYFRR